MRKKFDAEHLVDDVFDERKSSCGQYTLGFTVDAQTALHELCHYFLGDDWYDQSGMTSCEQVNVNIVCEIERQYRGAKIKRRKE